MSFRFGTASATAPSNQDLKTIQTSKAITVHKSGQDFRVSFKSTELGRHIARIGVAIAQCLKSPICGDRPLGAGAMSMATTIASKGARPMNTELYQRKFAKPTAPNIH